MITKQQQPRTDILFKRVIAEQRVNECALKHRDIFYELFDNLFGCTRNGLGCVCVCVCFFCCVPFCIDSYFVSIASVVRSFVSCGIVIFDCLLLFYFQLCILLLQLNTREFHFFFGMLLLLLLVMTAVGICLYKMQTLCFAQNKKKRDEHRERHTHLEQCEDNVKRIL